MSLFQGCQKEKFSDQTPTETEKTDATTLISTPRNFTMPVNDNGILRFTDRQHLWDYVEYLDALLEGEDEPVQEADVLLDNVEHSLSFDSYRRNENSILTIGIPNVKEYFENDYIVDIVFKSILNPYSEVYVGDKLNVWISLNQILEIDQDAVDIQNEVREMEKGSEEIPFHLLSEKCLLLNQSRAAGTELISPLGIKYELILIGKDDCDSSVDYTFAVIKRNSSTGQFLGFYTDDLIYEFKPNDPTVPNVTQSISGTGFPKKQTWNYNVSTFTTVSPSVSTAIKIGSKTKMLTTSLSVAIGPGCQRGGVSKMDSWVESPGGISGPGDGGPAVAMSSWLIHYKISGWDYARLKGGTRLFTSTDGAIWERGNGNIWVNPFLHQSSFPNCTDRGYLGEEGDCIGCHDKEVKLKFSDQTVFFLTGLQSNHEATSFGILLTDHLEMDLCP